MIDDECRGHLAVCISVNFDDCHAMSWWVQSYKQAHVQIKAYLNITEMNCIKKKYCIVHNFQVCK